ncbi:MAG: alpha-L-arabinofuranosidase C-terminal domain-containing protein [Bacillota bacterium]
MLEFNIDTNNVVGRMSHMVYGQMVEHAYWSVHLGLCAQMLDNGGFERAEDVSFYDDHSNVAQAWKLVSNNTKNSYYGRLDSEKPRNGHYSQKIVVDEYRGGHVRLQQTGVCAKKEVTYNGSVFLKGNMKKIRACLLSLDKQVIAEQEFVLTKEWSNYKIALTPTESCEEAIFAFVFHESGIVWIDQVMLYPSDDYLGHGTRADIVEKYKALRPAFLRWPGGAYLIWNKWKNAIGPREERLYDHGRNLGRDDGITHYREWAPNDFGVDEFIQLCRDVDAEPMINVAMLYPLQDTLDLIEYCNGNAKTTVWGKKRAENGHPEPYDVKYWIVDNEPKRVPEQKGFTPDSYARDCGEWACKMREKDPRISVSAMGDYDLEKNVDCHAMPFCEDVIRNSGKDIDRFCLHAYPDQVYGGPLQGLPYKMGECLNMLGEMIKRHEGGHAIPMAITEWNMQCFASNAGNLAQAIDSAQLYMVMERLSAKGIVDQACMCQMCVNTDKYRGSWLRSAMVQIDHVTSWVSPMYHVVKLFSNAFEPNLLGVSGDVLPMMESMDIDGFSFPAIDILPSKSDDGKKILLKCVNNTARYDYPAVIRLENVFNIHSVRVKELSSERITDMNTRYNPDAVKPHASDIDVIDNSFSFNFKRNSIYVFEIEVDA